MDKGLVERLAGRIEARPDVADSELFCVPMGELRALTAAQEEIERKDEALRRVKQGLLAREPGSMVVAPVGNKRLLQIIDAALGNAQRRGRGVMGVRTYIDGAGYRVTERMPTNPTDAQTKERE